MHNESQRMKFRGATAAGVAAVALAVTVLPAGLALAAPPAAAKQEQAASSISVTNYPAAAQTGYKVFADRCTRCHALDRVIAAPHLLPDQWKTCVERMANKWFSGINKEASARIQDFLVYDSSVRRKAETDAALAKLPADAKKVAEEKIKEVQAGYEKEPAKP